MMQPFVPRRAWWDEKDEAKAIETGDQLMPVLDQIKKAKGTLSRLAQGEDARTINKLGRVNDLLIEAAGLLDQLMQEYT